MKTARMGRTIAEKRTGRRNVLRMVLGVILLLLSAVPMLGGGVCALWTIPAAMCICMYEKPGFCMAAGVIGGLAIDFACGYPLGANAIFMVCFCTAASLLFAHLLAPGFLHYLFVTAVCTLLRSGIQYGLSVYFFHPGEGNVLWTEVLWPSAKKTMLAAFVIYLLYLPAAKLLNRRVHSMDAAAVQRPTL